MLHKLLERIFPEVHNSGKDEYLVACPFHDDEEPSLSVNTAKKLFNCHACGEKGDVPKLLARHTGYHKELVRYELNWLAMALQWRLPDYVPTNYINRLHKNNKLLQYLVEERHWSLETMREMQIGWDGDRIMIPVFNVFGDIVNVRRYKPRAGPSEYKVLNLKGFGKARLFGVDKIREGNEILFLEGEPDVIAARSLGFSAVSGTAGCKRFDDGWPSVFKQNIVTLCYDCDDAGRAGSARAAKLLAQRVARLKSVTLPEEGQDFTDFVHSGKTARDFEELVGATDLYVVASVSDEPDSESEQDFEIHEVSLSESSEEQYYRKHVKLRVMISGKTISPYIVPRKVKVTCKLPELKMCAGCDLQFNGGAQEIEFTYKTEQLLQLVETPIDSHQRIFKEMCGIPPRCKLFKAHINKAQNIEEVKVIPNLDFSSDDSQYVIRQVYFLGHGLEPNVAYEITALNIPHPKTQQVTYLSKEAITLEDTISAFKVTDDVIKQLKVFSIEQDTKET